MHDDGVSAHDEPTPHWLALRLGGDPASPFVGRRLRAPQPGSPQTGLRGVVFNGHPCECGTLLVAIRDRGPCCLNCGRPLALQTDERTEDVA